MGVYETEDIAKEVYSMARDLYFNKHLPLQEVRKKIKEKYYNFETKNINKIKGGYKHHNRYQVTTRIRGLAVFVGTYSTEDEAKEALNKVRYWRDFDELSTEEIIKKNKRK